MDDDESPPIPISHLRDFLGFFYQHVAETDWPVIIQRYRDQSVAMVPRWEWRWFKELEAKIQTGELILTEAPTDGH